MTFATASDKLARTCHGDQPGTALDRWRSLCLGCLIASLTAAGRDVTVIVGRKTDRTRGDFEVVMAEERN